MITVHYEADFAAEGGPSFDGPVIDPRDLTDETNGTIAVLYSYDRNAWVVADSQGQIMVEASTPAGLSSWLMEWTESVTRVLADSE